MTKSNWKKCKLGEICSKVSSGGTPKSTESKYYGGNIPWLRTQEVNFNNIYDTEIKISELGLKNSSAKWVPANTIIIAMYGNSAGRSAITKIPLTTNQACCCLQINPQKADYNFIFNILKLNYIPIKDLSNGGAQQNLNSLIIKDIEIILPPLEEQKRIAEVLGAFDDKIELLQKQNKTLEEMAKAIFKSWFVDFDIVKAKQKGDKKEDIIKNYHLTEELYNLFPSSFVDSSLGPIPLGWEVDKLINRCTIMLGGTPSRLKKEYWKHGTIPWIASGKVNDFRIATPTEYITQLGLDNSSAKLMPPRTTVIAITGATLGQISLTEIVCCANQSVVSVLGDKDLFSEYIYFWIHNNINLLLSKQTGGAQQHINKNDVESLLVLVPPNNILKPYLNQVKPLFDKISNNIKQIQTLTELRDTLLPRLISGKIKV